MKLTFPQDKLVRLVADATAAWPKGVVPTPYHDEAARPGFWLVGDEGVYLMHNGKRQDGEKPVVVYATECNPEKLPFDEWWENKRASFGGDDGVEYLPPELIITAATTKDAVLVIECTENEIACTVEEVER